MTWPGNATTWKKCAVIVLVIVLVSLRISIENNASNYAVTQNQLRSIFSEDCSLQPYSPLCSSNARDTFVNKGPLGHEDEDHLVKQTDSLKTFGGEIADSQNVTQYAKHKVYIESLSGLGNVIFEYASLYGISRRNNMDPVFVKYKGAYIDFLKLFSNLTVSISKSIPHGLVVVHEKKPNTFDERFMHLPNGSDVLVKVWLQSWKYFMPEYTEDLRQQFRLKTEIRIAAYKMLNGLTRKWASTFGRNVSSEEVTYVGVHVRRGDKLQGGWQAPDKSYFTRAAQFFREHFSDPVFVVASEDLTWSRENLLDKDFVFSESGSAVLDLALLSVCNHTIMSVGTFSWWAAWLAGGTAIYYENHVVPGKEPSYFFKDDYYFLPEWIPLV